ncbi:hypothetical protein Poli38472_010394 [Pythium oligandrum]|uniref:Uncharacterized protein n=1 Tax=Pythium oligandrum TaxID=41045 RepID=A0A8K1C3L5_PYTOL|nr:hypothetical protein Poli38472_010394 [Pythium oligandrum]|eukprot:TMW55512.1 hypothetical protein Poli38472_010394 [Pythium oligandrum]
MFCGGCLAFYQRDLLRMLLHNFDFLFSWVQVTLFGVCLCDIATWDVDRSLIIGSWVTWFYWALSLDALTPIVRNKVLKFPKLIATPVVLTVFVACLGAVYSVVFVPVRGLEDRVIWRYEITPTHSISIQTREFCLGRVLIIQLWYFRQLYMLLKREPNDLYVLHSRINLISAGETGMTLMSDRGKVFPSIVYTDDPLYTAMLVVIALCVLVMFVLCSTLSLDVVWLLLHQYEFWFITVFNTLNWISLAVLLNDARFVACVFGWVHVQMSLAIDANLRFAKDTARSAWIGVLGVGVATILALFNKIKGQNSRDLVVHGKTIGDLTDLFTLTSTTLMVFLFKILLLKRRAPAPTPSDPGQVVTCVVVKTTLRLCPSIQAFGSIQLRRQPSMSVQLHALQLTLIDAFDTVLPPRFWRSRSPSRHRWSMLLLRFCGIVGIGLLVGQNIRDIEFGVDENKLKLFRETTRWYDRAIACGAFIGTLTFCGLSVAFYQRGLLRLLVRNFDFLFSTLQITLLSLCFCDMARWDVDRTLLVCAWGIWFLWALSLDAVTPVIRQEVLGISRNVAIPMLTMLFIACITGSYNVTFMSSTFYNRTFWEYRISPTKSIRITTFDFFYGRVLTIMLWCSRQLYRLLTRAPNELYLLHGRVDLVVKRDPLDSPRGASIYPREVTQDAAS